MATMAFHYRPSLREGLNKGSLFIRIIHDRKVKTITTNYRIFPYEWDKTHHCLVFPKNDVTRKKYLVELDYEMQEDIKRLSTIIKKLKRKGDYTIRDILDKFSLTPADDMISSYAKRLSKELISNGQDRTARAYRTVAKGLINFNDGQDIRLEQINAKFIHDYELYLKQNRKNVNTVSFYMRNLRAIYHKAIREEMIQPKYTYPFQRIGQGIFPTWKQALTKEEMQNLSGLEPLLVDETLRNALKFFMFCFYARGMSFIDLAFLKKENIQKNLLSYVRKKTGRVMRSNITAPMRSILDYFSPMTGNSPYAFPIIKPELNKEYLQYEAALLQQNKQLKTLGEMAKIKKPLSTHMARHSWANVAHIAAIPVPIISAALGDINENTTTNYLNSFYTIP